MASCLNPNGRAIQSMSTTLGDCNRSEKQNIGRKQTYQASKKPNPMFGKTSDTNLNRSGLQTEIRNHWEKTNGWGYIKTESTDQKNNDDEFESRRCSNPNTKHRRSLFKAGAPIARANCR